MKVKHVIKDYMCLSWKDSEFDYVYILIFKIGGEDVCIIY